MKSFDTKDCNDFEVSSRKFPRTPKFRAEALKVSSRKFHQIIRYLIQVLMILVEGLKVSGRKKRI